MKTQLLLAILILNINYSKNGYFFIKKNLEVPIIRYSYLQSSKVGKGVQGRIQKKVIVADKHNKNLSKFIRKQFDLDRLEQSSKNIGQQEVNALLIKMKTSGYFRSVVITSKIINRQQVIAISCHSMPTLKSVNINSNKTIIIPQDTVLSLFNEQLGKPQNFKQINKALKNMYKWYYNKGYQWVNIKIVQDQKESIELKVAEGIINSIQFKFTNHIEELVGAKNNYLVEEIRDLLNIQEGYRLNYHDIERRLSALKQKRIFKNCDYSVSKSKIRPEQLDVLISIYELPDKTTFLLGRNTNFSPGVIEKIESKIFNSVNTLFKEAFFHNYQTKTHKNIDQGYLAKLYTPRYNYNAQKIVNTILTKNDFFSLSDLYEWYANPTHFINSNNLGMNYSLQNIGKRKEYIKVRFKFPNVYKNIILTYCRPWITFHHRRKSLIQLKILEQSFYSNHKQISRFLSQIFNHKFIFLDSLSTIRTFKAKLKTQLNNNWELNETLKLESIIQKKTGIRKKSEILFTKARKDVNQFGMNKYTFVNRDKQLINNLHSYFISIDTKLRYNFSDNKDINWHKNGNNLMIVSTYSLPIYKISQHTLSNHYKKFSQRTILKYTFYQNCNFPNQKQYFNHYSNYFDLEVGNLFGSSTFFPWIEKFEIKFPNYIAKGRSRIANFPRLLYRTRFEYHLGTPQNHSMFVFINYIYSDKRHIFHRNTDTMNFMSKMVDNDINSYRLNCGVGYQLKTSIRRLPPIRIEFNINPKSEATIYFRIIEVLSSIAIHKKT
nr:hypothetical protein [Erythrotrichia welwitschii]